MSGASPIPDRATHAFRPQRLLPALDPATVPLDDRSTADLLARALHVLRQPSGAVGTRDRWEAFAASDVSFLLAEMASVDPVAEYLAYLRTTPAGDAAMAWHVTNAHARAYHRLLSWRRRTHALAYHVRARADRSAARMSENGAPAFGRIEVALEAHLREVLGGELHWHTRLRPLAAPVPPTSDAVPSASADDPDTLEERAEEFSTLNRVTRLLRDHAQVLFAQSLTEKTDHAAHAGLLLAFVQLLGVTQATLNGLGARHLDFFYRRVLRLAPRPPVPDRCCVTFALPPALAAVELRAGTPLFAGKDASGTPRRYLTDSALTITRARVDAVRAIVVERFAGVPATMSSEGTDRLFAPLARFLALPVADSANGRGRPFAAQDDGWPMFSAPPLDDAERSALLGRAGVVVTSPALDLPGGARRVRVTLHMRADGDGRLAEILADYRAFVSDVMGVPLQRAAVDQLLGNAFRLSVTGPQGWAPVSWHAVEWTAEHPDDLTFVFVLEDTEPPLCQPREPSPDVPAGVWPSVRIELDPDARVYAYSWFVRLSIARVTIAMDVRRLRVRGMIGAQGPVPDEGTFPLFGTTPTRGTTLLFGDRALCGRRLDVVRLRVHWHNLPEPPSSFETHYAAYGGVAQRDFVVAFAQRVDGHWVSLSARTSPGRASTHTVPCFPVGPLGASAPMRETTWELSLHGRVFGVDDCVARAPSGPTGLLRLELAGPAMAFGHAVHPRLLVDAASRFTPWSRRRMRALLAHPPVTPLASDVSMDYTGSHTFTLEDAARGGDDRLWQLAPFGSMRPLEPGHALALPLRRNGYVFLGLAEARAGDVLSLYLEITEPDADGWSDPPDDPSRGRHAGDVRLRYLQGGAFREMAPDAIVSDSTRGLLRSGIVQIALPDSLVEESWGDTTPRTWIEISIVDDPARYGRVIGVHTQAVQATRQFAPEASIGATAIPAGSITRLESPDPRIAVVRQPSASWGGSDGEDESTFRARVSERLRHRQRAVVPRDYESLVLDRFPSIGEACCIPMSGARVVVVVVPQRGACADPARPTVTRTVCRDIAEWLRAHASASVRRIHVRSPWYEPIRVSSWIGFERGARTLGMQAVRSAIRTHIAPWQTDHTRRLPIGIDEFDLGELRAMLAAREQEFGIRGVAALSALQLYRTVDANLHASAHALLDSVRMETAPRSARTRADADGDVQTSPTRFHARTPWSVLVPADDLPILEPLTGIGDVTVGTSLTVRGTTLEEQQWVDVLDHEPTGIGDLAVGAALLVPPGGRRRHDEDDHTSARTPSHSS